MHQLALLADPETLLLDDIVQENEHITLVVRTFRASASCPSCGQGSTRVHSHYERVPQDLPWLGVSVKLKLQVRRYFCAYRSCERRIFCERLPSVIMPFARQTNRLIDAMQALAFSTSGTAGARTAAAFGITTSADTLLRHIRKTKRARCEPPHVIGVDDWAYRKGEHYGTIIVDLERREPIELLPDRHADTLAAWLADHPSITVIARDRSPVYAEAATRGAPQAVQVADRWHILKNLQEALQRFVTHQSHLLRQVREQVQDNQHLQRALRFEQGSPLSSRSTTQRQANRKKRESLHQAILDLHNQSHSQRQIAAKLGVCRNRVVTYLQRGVPTFSRAKRGSMLEPYLPYVHARWLAGHRNAMQLWRDVKAQGYPGTPKMVQRYITKLRAGHMAADARSTALRTPSVRAVTWWLSREADALDEDAKQFVAQFCASSPDAGKLRQMGLQFRRMMRERRAADLPGWLKDAQESGVPELKSFATGIHQDYRAVEAALSLEWSNGQTEGHITRLKYLKRQMYGRASFELLRARVLYAA